MTAWPESQANMDLDGTGSIEPYPGYFPRGSSQRSSLTSRSQFSLATKFNHVTTRNALGYQEEAGHNNLVQHHGLTPEEHAKRMQEK